MPDPNDVDIAIDRFEYLYALLIGNESTTKSEFWAPIGRFAYSLTREGDYQLDQLDAWLAREIERYGPDWPPFKAGFFNGSHKQLIKVQAELREFSKKNLRRF